MSLLSKEDKLFLLKRARESLECYLSGKKMPAVQPDSEILHERCGAFVTIHNAGRLRGCIGHLHVEKPLYETVEEVAVSAGCRDPRFSPVTPDEISGIDIEISVLSPLREIKDIFEIIVGTHGLLIRQNMYQGLLLPQVAAEHNWNREEFLEHTCLKAGLSSDAWKDSKTEIMIFSAEVFGENES
ncbi:AmmeMemoRadiSam system protein A [candidate division KSB1 bacterium]